MNHREPTSVPKGPGRTLLCLALLLPLMSGAPAFAGPLLPPQGRLTQHKPYLVARGAPPLRFHEPAPTAELVVRPPIPGASRPADTDTPADENLEGAAASLSTESTSFPSPSALENESETHDPIQSEGLSSAPTRTPRPILPDEMRPQARPEDFLPFFQIPAAHPGDVNVFVPAPRAPAAPSSLPLSSATYTQTPR